MPEISFSGPVGRIEARYHQSNSKSAPVALVLHPDPKADGTMNNRATYHLFRSFVDADFSVLRFNFPGVGKSEGKIGAGHDFIAASAAMDWLQHKNPEASHFWVAGFSFGSFIGMQLATRRPEVENFILAAPPVKKYDFSFSIPCPVSGLVVQGEKDQIALTEDVTKYVDEWRQQKNYIVSYEIIPDADHFFTDHIEQFDLSCADYINTSLAIRVVKPVKKKRRRRKKRDESYVDGDD